MRKQKKSPARMSGARLIDKTAFYSNNGNGRGMKLSNAGTIEKKFGSKDGLNVPL